MSLLFAGGFGSQIGSGSAGDNPNGTITQPFRAAFTQHMRNSNFPSPNFNISLGGFATIVQTYASPQATYPQLRYNSGGTLGAGYLNCFVNTLENFTAAAKEYVGGKGKLIIGARVNRTTPLGTGPLVTIYAAISGSTTLQTYGIPTTNELETYCEVVQDFTNSNFEVYVNGVRVYSLKYNPAVTQIVYIGSNYVTLVGASSSTASCGLNSTISILDMYVALDSDTEEHPFGRQGSVRIGYPVDITSTGGVWGSEPIADARTKIMTNGGKGGSLVASDSQEGVISFSKPVITNSGNWKPVGVFVESWSQRSDPSSVSSLEFTVSTAEGRQAIVGKSDCPANVGQSFGVAKQLGADDFSFETGIKVSVKASKPV